MNGNEGRNAVDRLLTSNIQVVTVDDPSKRFEMWSSLKAWNSRTRYILGQDIPLYSFRQQLVNGNELRLEVGTVVLTTVPADAHTPCSSDSRARP